MVLQCSGGMNSSHIFSRIAYWHRESCLISLVFSSRLHISRRIAPLFVPLKDLAHQDFQTTTVIGITNLESRLFRLGQEKNRRDCVSLLLEEWITDSSWEEAANSSCRGHTPAEHALLWCLLKKSLPDRTHLASTCFTEITSPTPLHLTSAKRNDKNISASDHGQMPGDFQMTQSFGGLWHCGACEISDTAAWPRSEGKMP